MAKKKIYLIGLDGFNIGIFQRLEKAGVIPRLSALLKKGIHGPLASTIPPYTGPAWVSLFTGVNPGRHGIFGFTRRKPGGYGDEIVSASHIKAATVWERLNASGLSTGIFNVPFTYPPRPLGGFLVSGMPAPLTATDFVYPDRLKAMIADLTEKYPLDVAVDLEKDWQSGKIIDALQSELDCKLRILRALVEEYDPDFLLAVFIAPDRLQHLWGKHLLGGEEDNTETSWRPLRSKIYRLFSDLDEAIGELAARLGRQDFFLLASDHGFTSFERTFYLNSWLAKEGYLKFKGGGKTISRLLGKINRPAIKKWFAGPPINRAGRASAAQLIDWSQTRAYASPSMEEGLYLNLQGREPQGRVAVGAEYQRVREEIRERLLKYSIGNAGFIKDILPKEEVYQGEFLGLAPDLLLIFARDGWNMSPSLTGEQIFRDWQDFPFGLHHREGIWGAAGGEIKARDNLVPARIEDIAPTIMSLYGLPIPSFMEGRAVRVGQPVGGEGTAPGSGADQSAALPPASFSPEEEAEIKTRLAGLGYI